MSGKYNGTEIGRRRPAHRTSLRRRPAGVRSLPYDERYRREHAGHPHRVRPREGFPEELGEQSQ